MTALAHAEAMARADGCPTPGCDNVEPPRSATGDGAWAGYLCTDCGAAWMRALTTKRETA
jgi:hypothetical protein